MAPQSGSRTLRTSTSSVESSRGLQDRGKKGSPGRGPPQADPRTSGRRKGVPYIGSVCLARSAASGFSLASTLLRRIGIHPPSAGCVPTTISFESPTTHLPGLPYCVGNRRISTDLRRLWPLESHGRKLWCQFCVILWLALQGAASGANPRPICCRGQSPDAMRSGYTLVRDRAPTPHG